MRELTFNQAPEAIAEEMRRDRRSSTVDRRAPAAVREFGAERVRTTPISEAAMTGMSIGAAGCGFRPIVDWRQVTFALSRWTRSSIRRQDPLHVRRPGELPEPTGCRRRRRASRRSTRSSPIRCSCTSPA